MIRTITLQHIDGRTATLNTAMNDIFLELMYPGWHVLTNMNNQVITWQAPDGSQTDMCPDCQEQYESRGQWPRNASGEFCTISHGLHTGQCEYHQAEP